jgi:hypothetical protein
VCVGRDEYGRGSDDADILNSPIPPPPVFAPEMSIVETQAAALVRKAPLPLREDYGWHSQIQKLINADAERARKQAASPYPSSWDAPIFGGTFERRRLKILNALFTCLTRSGMTPQLRGKEGRELSVTVGGTHVSFALDSINATKQLERERQGYGFMARGDKDKMRLTVSRWWKSEALLPSWQDEPRAPLESLDCHCGLHESVRHDVVSCQRPYFGQPIFGSRRDAHLEAATTWYIARQIEGVSSTRKSYEAAALFQELDDASSVIESAMVACCSPCSNAGDGEP